MLSLLLRYLRFGVLIGYLYIAVPFICLMIALFIGPRRAIRLFWAYIRRFLRIRVVKMGPACHDVEHFCGLVLCTHKGWGDFFFNELFGGAAVVERGVVAAWTPTSLALSAWSGNVIVINRASRKKTVGEKAESTRQLGERIVAYLAKRNPRILLFPEGHRHCQRGTAPLRTGVFRIAHDRGIPVLLAPAEGSQYIIAEKKGFLDRSGHPIVVNYAAIVDPKKFASFEEFFRECEKSVRHPPIILSLLPARIWTKAYDEACQRWDQEAASCRCCRS